MTDVLERWAVGMTAPIRQRLSLPLTRLAGPDERYCKQQLRDVASIGSRRELLAQLPVYLDSGSREEYARYRRWHQELPPETRSTGFFLLDQSARLKRVFVHDHIGRPEETSIAAWDVARVVHYVGLGRGARYLAEHEVWQVVARAARIALDAYTSWEAYGRGFRYGRWFWAGYWADGMNETGDAIAQLLAPGGGWRDLPWPVDVALLEARGAAPGAPAAASSWSWKAVRMFVDCPSCLLPVLVREVGVAVRCDGCAELSEVAASDAWRHGATPDEDEDEDEDEESEPDVTQLRLSTNLDDRIQRSLQATPPHAACGGCGAPIVDADVVAAADAGSHPCACGRVTAIVAAPAWLREIDANLRYVVGGPLTIGHPDGVLYLLRAEDRP